MLSRLFIGSLTAAACAMAGLSAQTRETTAARTATSGTPSASTECAALAGRTFENGTTITAATLVTSGTLTVSETVTVKNMPAFCRVQGVSKPSSDSNIYFEVWLPDRANWNGKFLSTGEGGFAGTPNYSRNGNDGALDEIVRRGYVTASTDTGHKNSENFWAIGHPEKAADYLYRAKHVTTVAAKSVIAAFYGRSPSRSYFSSCSNGGRQGLIEAQRYAEDFDGLVIGAPWNYQSHSNAGFVWDAQAMSASGAAIPTDKLPAINDAVLAACDKDDGLTDGVIADPGKCRFEPKSLTCKGADSNACLTPPQVAALQKVYEGPKNPRTAASVFPGFARGSEASWIGIVRVPSREGAGGLGLISYFSNLVFENPEWDFRTFDFDGDMTKADEKTGRLGNAIAVDYTKAKQRGVKIIQYHGWNDQTLQPAYSPQYYEEVVRANGGLEATQRFYRLFMIPGMMHCNSGPGASNIGGVGMQLPPARDAAHDLVTALERWVEQGTPPEQFIGTKFTDAEATTRTVKFTRPICLYPGVPRYKGRGDPNDAASFLCAK
jgi:Tannase and feruloyl esterase